MGLQKIVVLCLGLIVVGGAGWYVVSRGGSDEAVTQQSELTEQQSSSANNEVLQDSFSGSGSFLDLMALGDSFKCDYTVTDENGTMTGTSYVDGGNERYRMEGSGSWDGQTGDFGAVVDGEFMYWWAVSPDGTFGMKVPITETETSATPGSSMSSSEEPFDPNQEVAYDCDRWRVDASVFVPPSDIEFTDMAAMMNEMMQGMPEGFEMPEGFTMPQ